MWKIEVDTPPETDEQCERHEQYPKVVVGALPLRMVHVVYEAGGE
jgi:hypothetical protein